MKRLLQSLAVAAVALISGCGQGLPSEQQVASVIHQLRNAPDLVRHSGVRRIESYCTFGGLLQPEIYREQVWADGAGGFWLEAIELVQGGALDETAFKALQTARVGFHWRYRDFLVRDLDAFLVNYDLTSYGKSVTVAGRPCHEVSVQRKDLSGSYDVAIDPTTGLVLRYREYDETGALFSMMEYESYDANPDFTGVSFHQPSNGEVPLVDLADLGFEPVTPKYIADSAFAFVEATIVNHPLTSDKVAKLTFTDGVETIFFLDMGPVQGASAPAPIPVPKKGQGGLHDQGVYTHEMDVMRQFNEGPLTVMWGQIGGHSIVVLGKASTEGLQMMLESALTE